MRSYTSHVRLYLKPHLGTVRIDRLNALHVTNMFTAIEDGNATRTRPVGPATMQRIRATLRKAMSDAERQRLTPPDSNPAKRVEMVKVKWPKAVVWTDVRVKKWRASLDAYLAAETVEQRRRRGSRPP